MKHIISNMKLSTIPNALFLLGTLLMPASSSTSSEVQQRSLRGGGGGGGPARKLRAGSSCTVLLRRDLLIDPSGDKTDEGIECEMDAADMMGGVSGLSFSINGSDTQMERLKTLFESGGHVSGESVLTNIGGAYINRGKLHLPPGLNIALEKVASRRKLAVVTGDKPILVVKVTDVNGLARAESPAQIGDDIFGTLGDSVNLKSQLFNCSMGQLNVLECDPTLIPNDLTDPTLETNGVPNGKGVAPGVMEITIGVDLTTSDRYTVRNAVTTAVQTAIGEPLPGRYQQVMFILEGCYVDCGWAAYAYINSWGSVYQGDFYKYTGVQVHELGHNFNLGHSGGLDGQTYTDHTGMMGAPLFSDDVGKMCYNPAKNWQVSNQSLWLINENDDRIAINIR